MLNVKVADDGNLHSSIGGIEIDLQAFVTLPTLMEVKSCWHALYIHGRPAVTGRGVGAYNVYLWLTLPCWPRMSIT